MPLVLGIQPVTNIPLNFSRFDLKKGSHDKVFELLQEHLPEYGHHEMIGSVTRLLHELNAGKKVCTTLLKTPEREKFIYYSIPMGFDPPLGVTSKRSKAGLFKNTKER